MNNHLSPRVVVGAAIVGIVGAAGMFIYEQIYAEKRRAMLVKEVANLDTQVSLMRTELEALRELQKEVQMRHENQRKSDKPQRLNKSLFIDTKSAAIRDTAYGPAQSYASDSDCFADYHSFAGTDTEMDSEEYYDLHTDNEGDEDDTLCEPIGNEHALNKYMLEEDLPVNMNVTKTTRKNSHT